MATNTVDQGRPQHNTTDTSRVGTHSRQVRGTKDLNPDPLLTEAEAAAYVSYRPRTLASWRLTGRGPRFVAVSRTSVRYRRSDLDEWIESKLRRSTSDDGEDEV